MNKSFIYKFTVMKKILFSLFMLSLLSTSVIAQQPIQKSGDNNRNKEMHNTPKPDMKKDNKKCCMSVAETTKLQTEQLKTLLQLSDEQTRKVHAILLRGNQNDSIMNIQVEKMRKDQMAQHTAQAEAIKKLLTPQQQAAMAAMPAFASGKEISCHTISQCAPSQKKQMMTDKNHHKKNDSKSSSGKIQNKK
ncbi:unknown [Bacteroides sp. CAG:144]|nr:unknown [Bacteroides sp. CAG:144]